MDEKKVKMTAIRRRNAELPDDSGAEAKLARIEAGSARTKSFSKLTDAVAQSDIYVRNEPIPFAMEFFPMDWRMRYSDLYYPHAKGGGIYIDTPAAPYEIAMCEIKHKTYNAKGIRYTYVKSEESQAEVLARLNMILPKSKAVAI